MRKLIHFADAEPGMVGLGRLEQSVMDLLWQRSRLSVREVVQRLSRPLAYTTVMTTLDRLYKKGLLTRELSERAFLYSPTQPREEWERRRTGTLVAGILAGPQTSRDVLLSCLVEAVGQYDPGLLDELEARVRRKRKEMAEEGKK